MQKGHQLQFDCVKCREPVRFSIFAIEGKKTQVPCPACGKKYSFEDAKLQRHLKKFEQLCRQLVDSEEILADTTIGIDVGDRHIKIPYRLLLTRFSSSLELQMGDKPVTIDFRFEPLKDTPRAATATFDI
jgi:DNA-directed RNA polymerase subunit RPC12/RpoP